MRTDTPWYLFDPTSPGWIIRKHNNKLAGRKEFIYAEDVERILTAHPDAISEPIIAEYAGKARRGELRKPAGRRAKGNGFHVHLFLAREVVEDKMAAWKRARLDASPEAPPKGKGEPGLFEKACEEVAREMRFPMAGRSLANAMSRSKETHPLFW